MNQKLEAYPTGTCFDDAMEFIQEIIFTRPRDAGEFSLVHAICQADEGWFYSHAWVESIGECIFQVIIQEQVVRLSIPKEIHYRKLRIVESTQYSIIEALSECIKSETNGPWEEKYLKLCKDRIQKKDSKGGSENVE